MSIRDQLANSLKARRSIMTDHDEDIYNDDGFAANEFDDEEGPNPGGSDSDQEDYEKPQDAHPNNVPPEAQKTKFPGRPPPMVPFLQQRNTPADEPVPPPLPSRRPVPPVPQEQQEPPVNRAPPPGSRNKGPSSRPPPPLPVDQEIRSRPPPKLPSKQDEFPRTPPQLPQEEVENQWGDDDDVYLAPSTTQDQDQYLEASEASALQEETEYLAPSETPTSKLSSRPPRNPPPTTRDSIQSQQSYRDSMSSTASDYSTRSAPLVPQKTKESFQAGPMLPPNHPSSLKDSKTTPLAVRGRNLPQIPPAEESQTNYELLPEPPAQPKAAEPPRAIPSPRNKKPWQFSKKDRDKLTIVQSPPQPVVQDAGEVYSELPDDQPDNISGGSTSSTSDRPLPKIPQTEPRRKTSFQEQIQSHSFKIRTEPKIQKDVKETNEPQRARKKSTSNLGATSPPVLDINTQAIRKVQLRKTSVQEVFPVEASSPPTASEEPPRGIEQIRKQLEQKINPSKPSPKTERKHPTVQKELNNNFTATKEPIVTPVSGKWPPQPTKAQNLKADRDSGNSTSSDGSGGASVTRVCSRAPLPTPDQIPLEQCPWFFGDVDRKITAEKLKALGCDGGFLIRNSKGGGEKSPYSLSMYYRGEIKNLHIRKRPDGLFALGETKPNEQAFQNVYNLVAYHQESMIIIKTGGETTLTKYPM